MNKQEMTEKMVELSEKTKSKILRKLIELLYLSNNIYTITEDLSEWAEGFPTYKVVQKLFNCSKKEAGDLVNTLRAIDLSYDISIILFPSEEDKEKVKETLKQRLEEKG